MAPDATPNVKGMGGKGAAQGSAAATQFVKFYPADLQEMIRIVGNLYEEKKPSATGKMIVAPLNAMKAVMDAMWANAQALWDVIGPILQLLGTVLDAIMIAFLPEIMQFLSSMAEAVGTFIDTVTQRKPGESAKDTGNMIGGALVKLIGSLIDAFMPLFISLLDALIGLLTNPLWTSVVLPELTVMVFDVGVAVLTAVLQVYDGLVRNLTAFLANPESVLSGLTGSSAWKDLTSLASTLISGKGGFFDTLTNSVKDTVNLVVTAFTSILNGNSNLWDFMVKIFIWLFDVSGLVVGAIAKGVASVGIGAANSIGSGIGDFVGGIGDWIGSHVNGTYSGLTYRSSG